MQEARVAQQFAVMGEPDEFGFVEEGVGLEAEPEAFGDGDEPEGGQSGEERDEQEDRDGLTPRLQGLVPPFESSSVFISW